MMKGLLSGSPVKGSSSFLGTQKWKVKECLQKSAFCPKCCQGGGSWEGSYGPEEGSVAGRVVVLGTCCTQPTSL